MSVYDTWGHRRLHDPLQCHGSSMRGESVKGNGSCTRKGQDTSSAAHETRGPYPLRGSHVPRIRRVPVPHPYAATPLPCYLLPKTNFLWFNLPPKTHKGDKCDLVQDRLYGWR
eukprot:scaffold39614_cov74-Phaeocystis_antarctica.AAC.1